MFKLIGRLFKWSVIAVLVFAVLVPVIGKTRIENAWFTFRDHLRANVDDLVDTRFALKREIRQLQKEYPERIGDLRTQLREVERDLDACEQDQRMAREVVTLCEGDVNVLRAKLAAAEGNGDAWIEFRSERLGQADALSRAARIAETRGIYADRIDDLSKEDEILRRERELLRAELGETEREYRDFQAEVGTMIREIDSLKRKQRLVEMAEKRRGDADDLYTDRADALASLKSRIEGRKVELDERLAAYRNLRPSTDYEARARLRLVEAR